MNKIKYIFAQPLIGGMALGFEESFGCPPAAIITAGFVNDNHYIKHMNETKNKSITVIRMNSDYETFASESDEILYNKICKDVDVLAHVAICSGLSQMNSSNTGSMARGCADNDQNQNMYALTRLGMRMNAKVVVFENAPAAYTKSGEKTVDRLKEIAEEYDYSTHLIKTDTLLHGIPQSRKRTFLSFYNKTNPPLFNFEKKKQISIKEYFKNIPKDSVHYKDYIDTPEGALGHLYEFVLSSTNSSSMLEAIGVVDTLTTSKKATWTAAQMTEVLGFDKAIEYFDNKIKENPEDKSLIKIKSNVEHYKKKKEAGLSFWDNTTILANRGEFVNAIVGKSLTSMVNPVEERAYSIREMIFLMGMPHDFYLENHKSNWNHICQNVPVKTSSFIANQISEFLKGNLEISNERFVKQDNIKQKTDLG